jgi:hypothetical protein
MIVLFTDFGLHGPYVGQMRAVLHQMAPGTPVIDLFADAPVGNPRASAYLLAAYAAWFSAGTVFLCVVDPGVGGVRPAIILEADGKWYVGPGNGLFELVQRRAETTQSFDITWHPERLSASFHGRDLFAPVAAILARGEAPTRPAAQRRRGSPGGLARRPFRGRLHRSLRQCHDRAAGGHGAAQRKACRGGPDIGAGKDLQRSAAGHGFLVREFERPCRNRRQSGTCGP